MKLVSERNKHSFNNYRASLVRSYLFQVKMPNRIIHQISHVLTILVNSSTGLHAKEEVGNLCTFTPDDGREDTVEVFKVYLSQTSSNATVEKDKLGIIHVWVLNKDVAWVKVTVNKVVNKQLQREGERETERERERQRDSRLQ